MGDVILTTPVIRCLKDQTNAEIHFLIKDSFSDLLTFNPHISKLIIFKGDLDETKKNLSEEKYDLIIDLQKNRKSKSIASHLKTDYLTFNKVNIKKWILVQSGINVLPKTHLVDRYFNSLSEIGISNDLKGCEIFSSDQTKQQVQSLGIPKKYVAIGVGAQHEGKCLNEEQLKHLIEHSPLPVILLGGNREKELAHKLEKISYSAINLVGETTILESLEIVRLSSALVSGDTGLMHAAAAFSTPQLSIWGCTAPILGMYPYLGNQKSILIEPSDHSRRPCSKLGNKCKYAPNWCIHSIDPVSISSSLYKLLEE